MLGLQSIHTSITEYTH